MVSFFLACIWVSQHNHLHVKAVIELVDYKLDASILWLNVMCVFRPAVCGTANLLYRITCHFLFGRLKIAPFGKDC